MKITPGIWAIVSNLGGLTIEPTELTKDRLLDSFIYTKQVTDKIDCFFNKLHIYKEFGFEVPKRTILLYGPPGTGKTALINKACRKYAEQNDTAIILWKTDKHDPHEVKQLVKAFEYVGVNKLIVVAEDLGGVEIDQVRIKSESSLLSLLDNQEKAFNIPVLILVTTNFPENFLGNLMNRPQRIDDKIQVGYPSSEARKELFRFFARPNQLIPDEALDLIEHKMCAEFTPAHIKEVFVRSAIYDLSLPESVRSIVQEIELYKNAFSKRKSLGITSRSESDFDD